MFYLLSVSLSELVLSALVIMFSYQIIRNEILMATNDTIIFIWGR